MLKNSAMMFALAFMAFGHCLAQDYPNRPIRMLVPTAAGGGSDIIIRPVAQKVGEKFKQTIVVDNRAGASGIIAVEIASKSPADGYTLVFATIGNMATNFAVLPKLPFHPVRDFVPVTKLVESPFIVVVYPGLPINTLADLVSYGKKSPGVLSYGTFGVGSFPHLLVENFGNITGVKFTHVPYKGSAPAQLDLIAGQISLMFDSMQSAMPGVRAGRMRALGVTTRSRVPSMPEVPTIAESGVPGYEATQWFGLFTAGGTSSAIVDRLAQETSRAVRSPDLKDRMSAEGLQPVGNTPAEFSAYLRAEMTKWAKVVKAANIKPQQ